MGILLNLAYDCTPEELKLVCEYMINCGYWDVPIREININEIRKENYFPRGLCSFALDDTLKEGS